jgi:hypothetical protein
MNSAQPMTPEQQIHQAFLDERRRLHPECKSCQAGDITSHEGSMYCESGSIASGGTNSHCTCDWCF